MSKFQDIFEKKVLTIEGVKGYLFIKEDGRILLGKVSCSKPETLASMMVISQMDCDTIRATMGFTHFNFLMLTGKKNDMLFVFPVKKYFLGILYGKGEYDPDFVKKVQRFIKEITSKKNAK